MFSLRKVIFSLTNMISNQTICMISSGADSERQRNRMKRTQNIETFFKIKKLKAADNSIKVSVTAS